MHILSTRLIVAICGIFILPSCHVLEGKKSASPQRLAHWLEKAEKAYAKQDQAKLMKATGKVVDYWHSHPNLNAAPYELKVVTGNTDPLQYDEINPANSVPAKSMSNRYTVEGIGTPLIAVKQFPADSVMAKYQPTDGINRPLTAVLSFPENQKAQLSFYDPSRTPKVDNHTLAADFTAPWCEVLGNVRKMRRLGLLALFRAGNPAFKSGFILTQPYDPEKTPIIFVHGLLSSPIAWRNLANEVLADPEIRERYQVWFYHYPTGNPILVSAAQFRDNLQQLRLDLNPQQQDPAMQHSVVIGHSMGGLLSKTLITDSGDLLWRQTFKVTPDNLRIRNKDLQVLEQHFYWKPQSDVQRVIYIAVPHRGSKWADSLLARCAQRIIKLPESLVTFTTDVITLNSDALTSEAFENLTKLRLSSLDNLSPSDPTIQVMNELPTAPGVKRHSIIGNRGRKGPIELSSDGIVPYSSSHIADVESELVVPGSHSAYKTQEAVTEIIRILHLP